jgi:hypothetical protein
MNFKKFETKSLCAESAGFAKHGSMQCLEKVLLMQKSC